MTVVGPVGYISCHFALSLADVTTRETRKAPWYVLTEEKADQLLEGFNGLCHLGEWYDTPNNIDNS